MKSRNDLLVWERENLQRWLDGFDCGVRPRVSVAPSGETMTVQNFPLPDGFAPDRIDVALVIKAFPADPPKGLYILRRPDNGLIVARLQNKFNVFRDKGFHGAPSIAGFEWLCIGYLDGWRYHASQPHKGDNIQKMFVEFWRLLEE